LKASDEVGQQVLQACKDAGLIKGGEGESESGGEGAEGEAKAENGAARIALVGSSSTPTTPGGTQAATIVNNAVAQANAILAAPAPAVQASNVASSTTAQATTILSNAAAKSTQASRYVNSQLTASVIFSYHYRIAELVPYSLRRLFTCSLRLLFSSGAPLLRY
jgi:hypothetical protein